MCVVFFSVSVGCFWPFLTALTSWLPRSTRGRCSLRSRTRRGSELYRTRSIELHLLSLCKLSFCPSKLSFWEVLLSLLSCSLLIYFCHVSHFCQLVTQDTKDIGSSQKVLQESSMVPPHMQETIWVGLMLRWHSDVGIISASWDTMLGCFTFLHFCFPCFCCLLCWTCLVFFDSSWVCFDPPKPWF